MGDLNYHGSVGPIAISETVKQQVGRIANELAQKFSLAGMWGLDFILDVEGQVWPVDLNPRITASAELFETGFAAWLICIYRLVNMRVAGASRILRRWQVRELLVKAKDATRRNGFCFLTGRKFLKWTRRSFSCCHVCVCEIFFRPDRQVYRSLMFLRSVIESRQGGR